MKPIALISALALFGTSLAPNAIDKELDFVWNPTTEINDWHQSIYDEKEPGIPEEEAGPFDFALSTYALTLTKGDVLDLNKLLLPQTNRNEEWEVRFYTDWETGKTTITDHGTYSINLGRNFVDENGVTQDVIIDDAYCSLFVLPGESLEPYLTYELAGDGLSYRVVGASEDFEKTNEEFYIPSTHLGLPVTTIDDSAFERCFYEVEIYLPDTILKIGDRAFYEASFKNIHLPSNLNYIGDEAFLESEEVTFYLPRSLTHIGENAFGHYLYQDKLSVITPYTKDEARSLFGQLSIFENERSEFETYLFARGHYKMQEDGTLSLNGFDGDFYERQENYGSPFDHYYVPREIDGYRVESVTSLFLCKYKSVAFPRGLKEIKAYATRGLNTSGPDTPTILQTIDLPEGLETIGEYAFSGIIGMRDLFLPSSVETIGEHAFPRIVVYTYLTEPKPGFDPDWDYWAIPCFSYVDVVYKNYEGLTHYIYRDDEGLAAILVNQLCRERTTIVKSTVNYNYTSVPVKKIGSESLYGDNASALIIEEGVEEIMNHAFDELEPLSFIYIPSTVKKMAHYAMSGQHPETAVYLASTEAVIEGGLDGFNGHYFFRGPKTNYPDLVERDHLYFDCDWVETEDYGYIDYSIDGEADSLLCCIKPEYEEFDMNILPSGKDFSFAYRVFEARSVIMRKNLARQIGTRAFAEGWISGEIDLSGVKEIGDEAFIRAKFDNDARFSIEIPRIEESIFENADFQGHSLYVENSIICFLSEPYAFWLNNASSFEYRSEYPLQMTEKMFVEAEEITIITKAVKNYVTVINMETNASKIHIQGYAKIEKLGGFSRIETLELIDLYRIEDYAIDAPSIGYVYLQNVFSAGMSILGYLEEPPTIEIGGTEADLKNFDSKWNFFNETEYPYSFVSPRY